MSHPSPAPEHVGRRFTLIDPNCGCRTDPNFGRPFTKIAPGPIPANERSAA